MLFRSVSQSRYADDKNIWGGEVFIANKKEYKRAYHLKYFKLLGGELAIKEPKRVALPLLFDNFTLEEVLDLPLDFLKTFEKSEIKTLYTLWQKSLNSPLTSSFGRLFDAVCSLANILHIQEFEGQEKEEMRKEIAGETSNDGIKNLIHEGYKMLGLETYFTRGGVS